jgi:serine protease Do
MIKAEFRGRVITETTAVTVFYLMASSSLLGIVMLSSLYLEHGRLQHVYAQQVALSENTAVELAKPAVVKIYNFASISLSVQAAGVKVQSLQGALDQLLSQGKLDIQDSRAVLDALIEVIYQDPGRYLAPLPDTLNLSASMNATGSGFIVTPDGYIVSNAHVVRFPDYDIEQTIRNDRDTFFATFLPQVFADTSGTLENIFVPMFPNVASLQLTPEEENGLLLAFIQYYHNAPYHITGFEPNVFAEMRVSIPGVLTGGKLVPAEVIPSATGKAEGKDVAVLKVEGNDNLPTVALGDENSLASLDDIIAIGFPGSVSIFPDLLAQGIQPSITRGQFSGFQPTIFGFSLVQTSTPISHGSSGGPAVDSSGRVVGITTSTSINPVTGQEENSAFNFLIPVSIVKDFLNRINVHAQESQFTKMYRQTLLEFEAQNYSRSLEILEQLNRIAPGNPEVQNLISLVQTRMLLLENQEHQA